MKSCICSTYVFFIYLIQSKFVWEIVCPGPSMSSHIVQVFLSHKQSKVNIDRAVVKVQQIGGII